MGGFNYTIPIPPKFYDIDKGKIDWNGFREELRGKLCDEHKGFINGTSTQDLAHYFFGRNDLEACLCMETQIQTVRPQLLKIGLILRNTNYKWHIVDNAVEAVSFIENRTKRIVNAYKRTTTVSTIATLQYPELTEHPTVKALGSMSRSIKRLEEATTETTEITETTETTTKQITEG